MRDRDRDDDRRSRDRDDDRRGRDRDDDRRGREDRGRDRDDRGRDRDDRGRDRDDKGSRDRDRDEGRGSDRRGGGRRFEYQQRSADDVRQRSEMGASDYDKLLKPGVRMFKVNDGENRIRLLPPTWDGAKHYGLDVYVHYGVGPDEGSYICPLKHGGNPCPVCDEREDARRESNPDEQYLKDLEAKRRVLVYLIDRDNEREGVQAWFMPWTLDKDITKISQDKETREVLAIDHPEDGYDVTFDRSGSKARTKYEGVSISRRSSPLGRDEWLEFAMDNPLPEQIQVYETEHIAKAFGGKIRRNDRDDDRKGGRDDDRRGGADRDRDRDDRGGRDRDEDRGRGRGRDDDRRGGRDDDRRGGGRNDRDEPTWDSVHGMTETELEDLIELHELPIKAREAKDVDDLRDWVCEELKLEKPREDRRGSDSGSDRLRELRERRKD